ncbi:hypothetical protein B7R78_0004925 [Ralstonia solanacearum]|uniref:hypothetical protein n=1 Tax=Ralstonia solanacearum TaxID=305 RepID=UPI000BDD1E0F|nr:hypothetical protein [Ralstonia solanacearum]MBT1536496.1 hypothetical protein [Ralstonia solanacearum]
MAETSAQEALLAELLGDVHKLREEVSAISQVVPNVLDAMERAGGSAASGMEQLATRIDAMLNERIVQMASAVKDVSAMREMLVGAVALKASGQARAQLLDAVREVQAQPQAKRVSDHLYWLYAGLCGAAVSSLATAWIVLRLVSH